MAVRIITAQYKPKQKYVSFAIVEQLHITFFADGRVIHHLVDEDVALHYPMVTKFHHIVNAVVDGTFYALYREPLHCTRLKITVKSQHYAVVAVFNRLAK